ncbi:hypothetical protein FVD15_00290 [Campylobacter volucris]|uniref:Uncharacterized protein n=1 Tax=Campylobacter volucris TaxID=1031542 RepID=A0AAF1D1U2_9BACT|nr:hypothetical protein F7P61_06295 [Campylobacter volucris]QBL14232.1 hypothetical protein A9460_02215 [Campylobacter volucris]TXK71466.1 hypothetical protein FVD15_00290 [Campylobacter volucris]
MINNDFIISTFFISSDRIYIFISSTRKSLNI